jgi:hypothetical protein
MSETRNVILTIVQGADFNYVAPFILSLKRTGYRGRLIIFASAMKGDAVSQLERHGAIVIPFPFLSKRLREFFFWPAWPLCRRLFAVNAFLDLKEKLAHAALPLFYRRHLIYLQFLRAHRLEFDRVFLTDARDIFFQADPFSWNQPAGLHFFLLEGDHTINSSQLSVNWTQNQFGRTNVGQHLDKIVSCAGTTFGDTEAIITYLTQMVATSLCARRLRKMTGGDDQGVHNYLIYENLLPAVTLHSNRCSAVLTTTLPMMMADIPFNADGLVTNETGGVIPVIHQYDRLPEFKKYLLASLH